MDIKKLFTYRNLHIVSAVFILGVFTIAAIAYIQTNVAFIDILGLKHYEIGKCSYRENFGIVCPSCGLTRSFISIENFHFKEALLYNRVGILVYLLFLFILIFNIFGIFKVKRMRLMIKLLLGYGIFVCLTLLASWLSRFFFGI